MPYYADHRHPAARWQLPRPNTRRHQPPGERADRSCRQPGCGHVAPGELLKASFEFLLEREPATSILGEFSLDVISQYLPSYPVEIGARLGGSNPGTPR